MATGVQHLNPEGLPKNPFFTQAVVVTEPARTVYIGGQNAVTADGKIVGDNLGTQSDQVFANLATILEAAGGTLHDIIKWTIYSLPGQDIRPALAAFQRAWGDDQPPPAITGVSVAALANPAFLVEIEAIAIVRDGGR